MRVAHVAHTYTREQKEKGAFKKLYTIVQDRERRLDAQWWMILLVIIHLGDTHGSFLGCRSLTEMLKPLFLWFFGLFYKYFSVRVAFCHDCCWSAATTLASVTTQSNGFQKLSSLQVTTCCYFQTCGLFNTEHRRANLVYFFCGFWKFHFQLRLASSLKNSKRFSWWRSMIHHRRGPSRRHYVRWLWIENRFRRPVIIYSCDWDVWGKEIKPIFIGERENPERFRDVREGKWGHRSSLTSICFSLLLIYLICKILLEKERSLAWRFFHLVDSWEKQHENMLNKNKIK